ncbi:dipeptide/oligopeptide/nickel ABC transporter permease/ATP-binding protein [Streptomyces sp. NBC_00075]|uniref:dipeptide/oligopeptide/nickel ABC transporter permease/ATP-binding protein n=1 Tax=Streptomyces sp. NBC_00075 TaxID=2975641 RepID=UPI003253DF69
MSAESAISRPVLPQPKRPRRFRWTAGLIIGLALGGILVVLALVAPLIWNDAASTLTDEANLPSSPGHPLGTDALGRDMLARTLVAVRLTLVMTVSATAIAVLGGILLGTLVWLAPRRIRETGLRAIEIAVSYPGLLIALIIAAVLGQGISSTILAIGIAGVPTFARMTANMAGALSQREFIATARLLGTPPWRIVRAHLLPNMAEPLLVLSASTFATSLIEISGLSFVGLGVQSPDYDAGRLLVDALPTLYTRPIEIVGPVTVIVITGLAAMLIGDGLAAGFNVRAARGFARRKPVVDVPTPSIPAPEALLEVRDLVVSRGDGTALVKGISFQIERGEVLGVVGESGSGKSLTAMAIAQLLAGGLDSRATTLRLDDLDLRRPVAKKSLATRIGIVYQDPGTTFNPALRLGPQLTEVLRRHTGLSKPAARARILESLRLVQITEPEKRLNQHPHELSGGMRQRAMIATALASDPDLIIADEPTTALDVTVQADILREFRRINRTRGTAMLFISHDLGVVEELCDRTLVMREGEVIETLTGAELRAGVARHPYTQALLAATPTLPARAHPSGASETKETNDAH